MALGESTTFGETMHAGDETWPVMLEHLLNAEEGIAARVEVINAGLPLYDLADNLLRLTRDILPLCPDMIISYHGNNGFKAGFSLLDVGRRLFSIDCPARPAHYLRAVELALRALKHRAASPSYSSRRPTPQEEESVLSSEYARLYRELIRITEERGVQLVLLTFNMAVGPDSPDDAIRFYRGGFPDVDTRIVANQLHTHLVKALPAKPHVTVIDAQPGLNGCFDQDLFIDLMHFTNKGRERLAGCIHERIRGIVAEAIARKAAAEADD